MEKINSTNFHKFSAQEIFDFVCEKLVTQGESAMTDQGGCAYSINGRHCAAGWIITDLTISATDNCNLSWHAMVERYQLPDKHQTLISDLQLAHDKAAKEPPQSMSYIDALKRNLQFTATINGLEVNEYIRAN